MTLSTQRHTIDQPIINNTMQIALVVKRGQVASLPNPKPVRFNMPSDFRWSEAKCSTMLLFLKTPFGVTYVTRLVTDVRHLVL